MAAAAALILYSFRENMVFFYTPTQLVEKKLQPDFVAPSALRIGGLVKQGSVKNIKTGGIRFVITDMTNELNVTYNGLVPSLFQTILAKHDETYMPREVVDELKKSGRWKQDAAMKGVNR